MALHPDPWQLAEHGRTGAVGPQPAVSETPPPRSGHTSRRNGRLGSSTQRRGDPHPLALHPGAGSRPAGPCLPRALTWQLSLDTVVSMTLVFGRCSQDDTTSECCSPTWCYDCRLIPTQCNVWCPSGNCMVVSSVTASRSSAEGSTSMASNSSAQIDTLARSLATAGSRRMLLRSAIARAVG